MSPRQWAVDDSPQCSRDSGETGGNRKKQYPNPDECQGGRMEVSIYRLLQGVEKNSRCPLSSLADSVETCVHMRALASLIMSPRQWAVDDSPQCSRDSGETGGNRKKHYPNPDECRGGRMEVSIYRLLQGVEKNSRCSLSSLEPLALLRFRNRAVT